MQHHNGHEAPQILISLPLYDNIPAGSAANLANSLAPIARPSLDASFHHGRNLEGENKNSHVKTYP